MRGSTVEDLAEVVRRKKVTVVLDIRPRTTSPRRFSQRAISEILPDKVAYKRWVDFDPAQHAHAVGRLYAGARDWDRVLVVSAEVKPEACPYHRRWIIDSIAREAALYARSNMRRIIEPIEVKHLFSRRVGGKLSISGTDEMARAMAEETS
jgi:hypothetical protein